MSTANLVLAVEVVATLSKRRGHSGIVELIVAVVL